MSRPRSSAKAKSGIVEGCDSRNRRNDENGQGGARKVPFVYRVNDGTGHTPSLLHKVCQERGWLEFPGDNKQTCCADDWNLWWRTTTMNSVLVRRLNPWQLTNHIPKATAFCRKDFLARYLRRMHRTHGPIYDFSPMSFNLPLEYTRLCSEHSRRTRMLRHGKLSGMTNCDDAKLRNRNEWAEEPIWICKPVGRSQGRGIRVFDTVTELAYDSSSVVQEYILRPYLIGGYKWDLRIYVCILSIRPLRIYAYREGLVRFATNKYNLGCLQDSFSHLTNVSLNKQNPAYKQFKEQIGPGSKWTLSRLRKHFFESGVSDWLLWQRIMSILVLTIVGEAHTLTHLDVGSNCFEFIGFDILVTEDLKPTLLEVNTNPSLGNDCIVDEVVKGPMLHDLLTLLSLPDERIQAQSEVCSSDVHVTEPPEKYLKPAPLASERGSSRILSGTNTSRKQLLLRQSTLNSFSLDSAQNQFWCDQLKHDQKENAGVDQLGHWVRIFPFDSFTTQRTTTMSVHDVKVAIARMQSYLKIAQRIAGARLHLDTENDKLAKDQAKLAGVPWHPPQGFTSPK